MRWATAALVAAFTSVTLVGVRSASAQAADWDRRIEAAKTKAIEYLIGPKGDNNNTGMMRLKLRIVLEGGKIEERDAEIKDVVVVANSTSCKVKGETFDNVEYILPPGWFEPDPEADDFHRVQIGGRSGLAVTALLAAGVNPKLEPKMVKAIECMAYLHTAKVPPGEPAGNTKVKNNKRVLSPGACGVYAIGCQANALEYAMRSLGNKGGLAGDCFKTLNKLGMHLQDGYRKDAGYDYRLYDYKTETGRWDLSVTQYGILGLWAAARGNVELNDRVWRHLNQFLLEIQNRDGGWGYTKTDRTESYDNMNAAGIASLFVMMDIVHTARRGSKGPDITPFANDAMLYRTVQAISRAMEHWNRTYTTKQDGYFNYGVERVGVASGYKYFGDHDWFKEGATLLMRSQGANGAWNGGHGPVCQTSWNLLFLVYGGAPILINKLEYAKEIEDWHNYPRDAANLARWYSKEYETLVNWQILPLDPKKENDLLDAPFTMISGHKKLNFSDTETDILKRYVENGGTLLFMTDGNKRDFVDSVLKLSERMYPKEQFPEFQFTEVTKDHPMYTELKPTDALRRIKLWHMNNGHRSFAFLVPEDIHHLWQSNRNSNPGTRTAFQIIQVLRNYATDKAPSLPGKIRPGVTEGFARYSGPAKPPVKVAVVRYTSLGKVPLQAAPGRGAAAPVAVKSDWATMPATWRVFGEWFQHVSGHAIEESRGISLTDPALSQYDVLHFTGHYSFRLTPEETTALKNFVTGGGSAIFENTGGLGNDFYQSAVNVLRDLFPNQLEKLSRADAVINGKPGGYADVSVGEGSRQLRLNNPTNGPADMIRGVKVDGRVAVIVAPCDLAVGLAGQKVYSRIGFQTNTTRDFVANFLMLSKSAPRKPVAAAGATAAAGNNSAAAPGN